MSQISPTAPSATPWTFSLGGVPLDRFEVPSEFSTGHEIELKVHKYFSETGYPVKKIQAMGAFSAPTSWKGIFLYQDAADRSEKLDKLAVAQQPVLWVFGPYQYTVYIRRYIPTWKHQHEIEYEIDLEILSESTGVAAVSPPNVTFPAITQQFYDTGTTAVANLQTLNPQSFFSEYIAVVNQYNSIVLSISQNPIAQMTYSELLSLTDALTKFTGALGNYTQSLQNTAVLTADLEALMYSLQALNAFTMFSNNIKQVVGNGAQAVKLQNFVGSLFNVAAQYYPGADPTVIASTLAQANNLNDYYVNTPITLYLPPVFA